MPGMVIFGRRWTFGSDDMVVPGLLFLILHVAWLTSVSIIISHLIPDVNLNDPVGPSCLNGLYIHVIGYNVILALCVAMEATIVWVSLRGTIVVVEPRRFMKPILYARFALWLLQIGWLVLGFVWFVMYFKSCKDEILKERSRPILGVEIANWISVFLLLALVLCTFDTTGRSFYVENNKRILGRSLSLGAADEVKRGYRLSRQLRYLEQQRLYEARWRRRFRMMCCCARMDSQTKRESFQEIAQLFASFFGGLDIVPSDIVAGLMLLRREQKSSRQLIVDSPANDFTRFLSGIPISRRTNFLNFSDPKVVSEFLDVRYYFRFAVAAYGWPLYALTRKRDAAARLVSECCRCIFCIPCSGSKTRSSNIHDNCCHCNMSALHHVLEDTDVDIIYAKFNSRIGEPSFLVLADHGRRKVVVSIRGTLSLQDCLTDILATGIELPLPRKHASWLGHKGMVNAATYLQKHLENASLLSEAFAKGIERSGEQYGVVIVGHSLGAGTAALLSVLMKETYPTLQCYAYSPPGGLISEPLVYYTKKFITSVVVGKDVVVRIGLAQLENLRYDILDVMKRGLDPKWKVISSGLFCCCSDLRLRGEDESSNWLSTPLHSGSSGLGGLARLSCNQTLFPPGRIIHILRTHPRKVGCIRETPTFTAVWADNASFDKVIISPAMIDEHMPDYVANALDAVECRQTPGAVVVADSVVNMPVTPDRSRSYLVMAPLAKLDSVSELSSLTLSTEVRDVSGLASLRGVSVPSLSRSQSHRQSHTATGDTIHESLSEEIPFPRSPSLPLKLPEPLVSPLPLSSAYVTSDRLRLSVESEEHLEIDSDV